MDIEGAEMIALQGMAKIIKENKDVNLITEVSLRALQRAGVRPEDYVNKLVEYGFKLYYINEAEQAVNSTDVATVIRTLTTTKSATIDLFCERKK